ncbi:hypothetical protein WDV93_11695 [Pantoea ananatis]
MGAVGKRDAGDVQHGRRRLPASRTRGCCCRRGRTVCRRPREQVDVYDRPGRFVEHGHGEHYARIRQEVWQVGAPHGEWGALATGIASGLHFFSLNAPHFSDNGKYTVTSAHYDF